MQLPSDGDASGRNFGKEELELLERVIRSGTLHATKGTMTKQLEQEFANQYGVKHCIAVTSGTASLHTAIAAIDPNPGDEIITTPITDMGGLAAILFQNAVPIFADVDPQTYNLTAETIQLKMTPRTKAIIVVHLFGNPCDMDPILKLADDHGVPVVEDSAQAYLTSYKGRLAGTMGAIGCFSLQQTKQMTCGEGGLVITNDDALARRMRLFRDKAWGYGDPDPDHYFLALNYRMTDLQGAVALAQLRKLDKMVTSRRRTAEKLTEMLSKIEGLTPPIVTPGGVHTYWRYCLQVEEEILGVDVNQFASLLKEYGIVSAPRYIQKPAFQCALFKERKTYGTSQFPYRGSFREGLPEVSYDAHDFPGTMRGLSKALVLPWNERYTQEHVEYIAQGLTDAVEQCEPR
jgi:dTDP-4-amino-4,6-dideoxygalactose transaminase